MWTGGYSSLEVSFRHCLEISWMRLLHPREQPYHGSHPPGLLQPLPSPLASLLSPPCLVLRLLTETRGGTRKLRGREQWYWHPSFPISRGCFGLIYAN